MRFSAQLQASLPSLLSPVVRHCNHFCCRFIKCFILFRDMQYDWNELECDIHVKNEIRLWESGHWWHRYSCSHIRRAWCTMKDCTTHWKIILYDSKRNSFAGGGNTLTRMLRSSVNLVYVQWILPCNLCGLMKLVVCPRLEKIILTSLKRFL